MNGYKTYLIAILAAAGSVGTYLQGSMSVKELITALLAAAALAGLRHGVEKNKD